VSEESELVAGLRSGRDESFEELMRVHGPRLLRLARRLMRTEEDALDCFQDAMLAITRKVDEFQGKASLGTWLHRVVVNACLMKLRKPSSRAEGFIDDLMPTFDDAGCRLGEALEPVPAADALLEREQTRAHVRATIDELPDGYRMILILRDIDEMSADEVAEALSITSNLVNVRLHRARAALKKLLEPTLFTKQRRTR
jgi:RNA polymerase sigma-70 factor (ECF subfamily)